jgi:ribosomal protein L37AE/L43A
MPKKELPEDVTAFLIDLVTASEMEDEYVRQLQIKTWKKLEEFWHGIQYLFWNEIKQDWEVHDTGLQVGIVGEEMRESVGPFYDYVINKYKAHGESIISALSQQVPVTEFFPDDADEPDDLTASQAKNHLAIIYQKHVKAKLVFIDALLKLYNQGLVAAYRFREGDKAYGVHKIKKYKTEMVKGTKVTCPECGTELQSTPSTTEIPTCPTCNMQGIEEPFEEQQVVEDGFKDIPKEREKLEIKGPLQVKVAYYCKKQKDFGYLIDYEDIHYAQAREMYPDFAEDLIPDAGAAKERWARTPSSYTTAWRGGSEDVNLCSIKRVWLRPWMYNMDSTNTKYESNSKVRKFLQKEFPEGIHFDLNNKKIIYFDNECMDKCWTIGKSGPSTFIHSDPIGKGYESLQEMTNQMANLTIQTIEYGIPMMLADTRIINRDLFGNLDSSPGKIIPVRKPPEFSSIGEGLYEQKLATPSKEIETFQERLDEDGQFVLGDYPSIYGGASEGKSRTLGEYVQSGQRALARLSLAYTYLDDWWKQVVDKGTTAMAEDVKRYNDPMKEVVKNHPGQFENVLVTPEELVGKAHLEPESSSNFPISSDQKMNLLMQLIQLQNPMVESVVGHPENAHIITEALGFPDLYIPGEAQRYKALVVIKELLKSAPEEVPNLETAEMQSSPTIKPDETVDDEEVQIAVFKYFLSSEKGMQERRTNPPGYANCRAYLEILQQTFEKKQEAQMRMMIAMEQAKKAQHREVVKK